MKEKNIEGTVESRVVSRSWKIGCGRRSSLGLQERGGGDCWDVSDKVDPASGYRNGYGKGDW